MGEQGIRRQSIREYLIRKRVTKEPHMNTNQSLRRSAGEEETNESHGANRAMTQSKKKRRVSFDTKLTSYDDCKPDYNSKSDSDSQPDSESDSDILSHVDSPLDSEFDSDLQSNVNPQSDAETDITSKINANSKSKPLKCSDNKHISKSKSKSNSADSKTRKRTIEPSRDKRTFKNKLTDTTILEADVRDFEYLIGKTHRDDQDLQRYVTERIYIDRNSGNIVGSRVLLLKDERKHRSRDHTQFIYKT